MRSLRWSSLVLVLGGLAGPAFGQDPDGGRQLAPRSANPGGADDPAEPVRELGIKGEETPTVTVTAPVYAPVALPPADAGSVLIDDGVVGRIGAAARFSHQTTSTFAADELGTTVVNNPLETRLRINPEVHFRGFGFAAEADTAVGAIFGLPRAADFSTRTAHPDFTALQWRQLYVEYKWKSGLFRAGQQASHWGLGILTNAGAKDPEAGEFGQQHFGSLAYRALLVGRPLFRLGGIFRAIEPLLAADLVVRDDRATFDEGDEAIQAVFALRYNVDSEHNFGLYAVYRRQRAREVTDGARASDTVAIDFAGKWQFGKNDFRNLSVGFEIVGVTGTTTFGRTAGSANAKKLLQVQQWGAAAKLSSRLGRVQVYLDCGYASGDPDGRDDRVESFRFDRDYKVGLVLFDEVLGWQSARAAARWGDPVDAWSTGGSVASAWYLFPRARYGVREWFDVYGGPLFAFATTPLIDPFKSNTYGLWLPQSFLGGWPGSYLGTELDLGAQVRWTPVTGVLLSLTFEGGLLFPGDAFRHTGDVFRPVDSMVDFRGRPMDPVGVARLRFSASL